VLLTLRELGFSEPILDLRIFKYGVFVVANLLAVAMSFVLFGAILLSSALSPGVDGLQRIKGGTGAGTAQCWRDGLDAAHGATVARRKRNALAPLPHIDPTYFTESSD
jgi:hypothetical protein